MYRHIIVATKRTKGIYLCHVFVIKVINYIINTFFFNKLNCVKFFIQLILWFISLATQSNTP